MPPSRFPFDW